MSAPSDPRVWWYDGRSALRREGVLLDEGDRFRLGDESFAWADLLPPHADAGEASYGLKGAPGWRLGFVEPPPPAMALKLPRHHVYGGWVDRWGLWPAAALFAGIAALVVWGVLRTPAMVARLIPASVERRMGELMVGDFGRRGCQAPAGKAALDALVRRVDPEGKDLEVHVVAVPMVNAVTLPGGRVVLFSGLLRAAESPDEVAGVLGHELGHVRHRDVTEALVRQLGLSVLLGGMDGNVGGYTNALLSTAYSRRAETRADLYAQERLRAAAVSPAATAAFFRRLGKGGDRAERLFAYVASHPVSADRARAFAASGATGAAYRPALDAAQWTALKDICKGKSERFEWRF